VTRERLKRFRSTPSSEAGFCPVGGFPGMDLSFE